MTKKVLIVTRRETRKNKLINWVSEIYLQILAQHGIVPLLVPIAEGTLNILNTYLQDYDGLLMIEGGDVHPCYYSQNYNIEKFDEIDILKDQIETACFTHARSQNKPILGLCRGMHLINVMFGGTLYHDVHEENKNAIMHINYKEYDTHRHAIEIYQNTPLYDWYNMPQIQVNTYHHQGIQKIAPDLVAMAKAPDGLIEGIYHPQYPFLVGLQFHPERMLAEYKGNALVFESFIRAL